MKISRLLTLLMASVFVGCSEFEPNYDMTEVIKTNAENVMGLIDANQNWNTVTHGQVSITADANLRDITMVQILTESPFINDQAKVLAEVNVSKGQTVTLNYDAPRGNERLIAACIDDNGNLFIKGFYLNEKTVSFQKTATSGTRSLTRAVGDQPDLAAVKVEWASSFESFNAKRTMLANDAKEPQHYLIKDWMAEMASKKNDNITLSNWQDSHWEMERMWVPTNNNNLGSSWTVVNNTVRSDAAALDDDEKATLEDIFQTTLYRQDPNDGWGRRDNVQYFREGNAVRFFGNHLVTDGKAPVTLSPIQLASSEIYLCHLYYYYYKPADVPAGMTDAEYIKLLPKFKAIDLYRERLDFKAQTGISESAENYAFLRLHSFMLPFYGEPSAFMPEKVQASSLGTTDGKLYRIHSRLRSADTDWYMTYTSTHNQKMKPRYADDAVNVENQLWQIFTTPDGHKMLYNVGAKRFLDWNYSYGTRFVDYFADAQNLQYQFDDAGHIIWANTSWRNLRFNYDTGWTQSRNIVSDARKDSNASNPDWFWDFEEYTGSKAIETVNDVTLYKYPSAYPTPSAVFDQGYRIGFVLRKQKDNSENNNTHLSNTLDGELYGNGDLNTIINRFGQFYSSTSRYTLANDDPRVGMFNANGKTYLCFEDGSDAQFSDAILELGGVSTTKLDEDNSTNPVIDDDGEGSGVYMFDDVDEQTALSFTMCFEDRPYTADYDMNDVVLRCVRESESRLRLTLVATGAQDRLNISGISGTLVEGTDLGGKEVHELFGVASATGDDLFVNTVAGAEELPAVSGVYEVGEMTIPQFLSMIYIKNLSEGGNEIRVPKTGEPPFALIIPGDFNYPRERQSIVKAYTDFRTWANNANNYANWLNSYDTTLIYINPFSR